MRGSLGEDKLVVNGEEFVIQIKKSKSRTSSVRLVQGKVVISLSRFLLGRKREEMYQKFVKWAQDKLQKSSTSSFVRPKYQDGAAIVTHNKIYNLAFSTGAGARTSKHITNSGEIKVVFAKGKINDYKYVRDVVEKIIIKDQTEYLQSVVKELNELHFKEKYNLVRFKRMYSRFGSCSNKRNINISYNLLFAPREVFRYVCVHELAHLKEFNHSQRFWALVEEAMPDYREKEKWLKDNGFMLG